MVYLNKNVILNIVLPDNSDNCELEDEQVRQNGSVKKLEF